MMKLNYVFAAALTALSSSGHASFASLDQQVNYFEAWAVACNNLHECKTSSLPNLSAQQKQSAKAATDDSDEADSDASDEEDVISINLELSRQGAADSPVEIAISDWAGEDSDWETDDAVTLTVDQQTFKLGKLKDEDIENGSFKLAQNDSAEILALLEKSQTAELTIAETRVSVSLKGFKASLQYIDEQQQRVDTQTALIKKGDKPFTASEPQAPVLSSPTRVAARSEFDQKALEAKIHSSPLLKSCLETAPKAGTFEDQIVDLDSQRYLVGVTCQVDEMARKVLFLVVPKDNPEQAVLAKFDQGADDALVTGMDMGYEPASGRLLAYQQKSELGDCGSTAEWLWTGESFALTRYDTMPECKGSLSYLNVWKLNVTEPKVQ